MSELHANVASEPRVRAHCSLLIDILKEGMFFVVVVVVLVPQCLAF